MSNKYITDPQIIAMFDNWKNHIGKYLDLQLAEVEFEYSKLGDIAILKAGGTPPTSNNQLYYKNGAIPWFNSGDLYSMYIDKSTKYITDEGLQNSSAYLAPEKSVLIAMYGATAGQVSILKIQASTNQAVCAVHPNDKYYPEYLYYFITSHKNTLKDLSTGTGQPNISKTILEHFNVLIPLDYNSYPSYDIQVIIAEFIEFFIDKVLNMAKFIQGESANIKTYLLNTIFDNEQEYITDKPTLELFELWKKIYKQTEIKLEKIKFASSSITDIVEFINGSEFPKNYVKEKGNQGCIPLISAGTKIDIMGHIKSLIGNNPNEPSEHYVYNTTKNKWNNVTHYFGKDYYTLTADGVYGGTLIRRKQSDYPNGFYTTNVCKVLDFINDNIVTDYFLYAYQSQFLKSGFGFATKAKNDNLKLIVISIPQDYNSYSSYDIQAIIADFIYDVSEKNAEFAKNVETYIETIKLPFLNAIFG